MTVIPGPISRPTSLGAALKHEYDRDFCRETRTLKAGNSAGVTGLAAEHPTETDSLGRKKVVPWAPGASDGTQNVTGLFTDDHVAPAGVDNDYCQVIVRGPAILFERGIGWPAGVSAPQKAAAIASLKALNILTQK